MVEQGQSQIELDVSTNAADHVVDVCVAAPVDGCVAVPVDGCVAASSAAEPPAGSGSLVSGSSLE